MYFSTRVSNPAPTPPAVDTITTLTGIAQGGERYVNWGETRYLTETEWGTNGSHILGTNIQTLGTRIETSGQYDFALSHSSLQEYINGAIYSMSWYQPAYASTYSGGLRRYNGGGADASRVQGYCMAGRALTHATPNAGATDIVAANGSGVSGIVTLTGASALVASAVVFGAASLAF